LLKVVGHGSFSITHFRISKFSFSSFFFLLFKSHAQLSLAGERWGINRQVEGGGEGEYAELRCATKRA
jgi:hypothetical protein